MKSILPYFLVFIVSPALAQDPVFLNDFSTDGADAFTFYPEIEGITVGDQFFFLIDDGKHGEELWRTNGTAVGTQLIKDINPDETGSAVKFLAAIGNVVYFSASDDEHGYELWVTQGTTSSTQLIDINQGSAGSGPAHSVVLNDVLYFSANGDKGIELYRSEGTEATTSRVRDINTQTTSGGVPYSSSPSDLTVVGEEIYFTANDGDHGTELWKSDGTFGGTAMVKDINPDGLSTSFFEFKSGASTLYFTADDGVNGRELWKSDGSEGGTVMIKDITAGSGSSSITFMEELNGTLYFIVRESFTERNLWKTDGTEGGTTMVQDGINTREFISYNNELFFKGNYKLWKADGTTEEEISDLSVAGEFTVAGGMLYFVASEGFSEDGLWKTDGTAEGVTLVKEITSSGFNPIEYLEAAGDNVFFIAETDEFGREIWASDGTTEGTFMLVDSAPGTEDGFESYEDVSFGVVGDLLLFVGWDKTHGRELWKTDGTTEGTELVKDINSRSQNIRLSGDLVPYGDHVYFLTDEGLWKSDGTAENTILIQELIYASGLNLLNGELIFTASTEELSRTIWTSNGSTEGTQPLFDAETMPGSLFLFQSDLPQINGTLFFSGRSDEHGNELWKTDGTVAGTAMVKDINEGTDASFYSIGNNKIVVDDILYFAADDGILGEELWKTDGTEAGTVPVSDINPFGASGIAYLTETNGEILFAADDGTAGYELWKTDGTTEGTVLVKDIYPGEDDGFRFNPLVRFQDMVFFTANDGTHGRELWKSDGTEEGTVLVKDIYSDVPTRSGNPRNFQVIDSLLYFVAKDETGTKIWRTDGTEEGSEPFLELEANYVTKIMETENVLFFTANDGEHGFELWRTRKGDESPVLTSDIIPGSRSAGPRLLGYYNGTLYFTATDDEHGNELWTLTPLDLQVQLESSGTGLCQAGEPAAFEAAVTGISVDPEYVWYVNDQLVADLDSSVFTTDTLSEGDKVKVQVIAGPAVWVREDSVFSESTTIDLFATEAEIDQSGDILSAIEGAEYQWFLDGEELPDTTQSITAQKNGIYQVKVTNDKGCSVLSNEFVYNVTGLEPSITGIKMYPNPAVSSLFIELNTNVVSDILIYDVNGHKMYEDSLDPHEERFEISLHGISDGLYLVHFIGEEGAFQQKLVKH